MPSEIPLMGGEVPCRGADALSSNTSPGRRNAVRREGRPIITIDSEGNLIFSCNKEAASGLCLISSRRPCAVRPILANQSAELPQTARRIVRVKGGIVDYDPTENTVYNWPGKPKNADPKILAGHKATLLDELTQNPGKVVGYKVLFAALWPEGKPATANTQLQKQISELREEIGADTIKTVRELGYGLSKPDNEYK